MLTQIIIRERVRGFPGGSVVKNPPVSTGDVGLIPGLGRSREEHGNPLQYSCLEIAWTEEPGRLQSMGSQRVNTTEQLNSYNSNNKLYLFLLGMLILTTTLYNNIMKLVYDF